MYQPPNGHSSTTVMFGWMPKKASVSTGWRYLSRAFLVGGAVVAVDDVLQLFEGGAGPVVFRRVGGSAVVAVKRQSDHGGGETVEAHDVPLSLHQEALNRRAARMRQSQPPGD